MVWVRQLCGDPTRQPHTTRQNHPMLSRSNGITEGFHTKMEMMSRRAYEFRNFENYRLRVLTHCGWDGIINRV